MKLEEKQSEKESEKEIASQLPIKRQIIIETDGNIAKIVKAEVAGSLELRAILQGLLEKFQQ